MTSPPVREIALSEILSALSRALDLTEGQPYGHSARTCLIGMRIADVIGLPPSDRAALFYALLLKDAGCSSNAAPVADLFAADDRFAKGLLKRHDWSSPAGAVGFGLRVAAHGRPLPARLLQILTLARRGRGAARSLVAIRCERGADIARQLGFPPATAEAIRRLDEHWDGGGYPDGLKGHAIPLLARIACLSQAVEAFATAESVAQAYAMARRRSGRWFDPELVRALETFEHDSAFWARLAEEPDPHLVASLEPEGAALEATEERIDLVAWAFAGIIDAKSPFTFRHSTGVCRIALAIGARLGLQREEARDLMRVALLHDIGKLGVPNTILDKPGRLTPEEMAIVRRHPVYSEEILERVAVFRHLAPIAGAHHERLDGQGYPRGLSLATADRLTRILPVADVFEALTADRPYRPALPTDRALAVLREGSGRAYWPEAVTVLAEELASGRLVRTAGEWHDPGATA